MRMRLVTGAIAAWFAVILLPMAVWGVASSWRAPDVLPTDWGFRGWSAAFAGGAPSAVATSFALGAVVAAIATPLGAVTGRALGWKETGHPGLVSLALIIPIVLPPFAVSLGLDVALLRIGVPEPAAVVLLLVVFALPYTAYTMRATYQGIDPGLEAQARVLGATPRQARWRAVLPAARTGLVTAAGLAFLVGWSDYVVTLLIGGGQLISAPLLLGSAAAGSGNEPTVAALALLSATPPVAALCAYWIWAHHRTSKTRTLHATVVHSPSTGSRAAEH